MPDYRKKPYWEGSMNRREAMMDMEERRKLSSSRRQNSEVDEEAKRMESRSMREAGPSIMDKMPKKSQDEIYKRMSDEGMKPLPLETRPMPLEKVRPRLATTPMFQKKK